jgi:TRAP-type C4-dicarboxylate transport system permease small subunit
MTSSLFGRGIELLLAGLIAMISATLVLEVVFRYLLTHSLLWAEEFSRFLFLWTAFIGAAVAVGRGMHFSLRTLADALPPAPRRVAGIASVLAVGALALLLVVEGWRLAHLAAPQMSTVLGISRFWFYLAIPVGGALMLLYLPEASLQMWREAGITAACPSREEPVE